MFRHVMFDGPAFGMFMMAVVELAGDAVAVCNSGAEEGAFPVEDAASVHLRPPSIHSRRTTTQNQSSDAINGGTRLGHLTAADVASLRAHFRPISERPPPPAAYSPLAYGGVGRPRSEPHPTRWCVCLCW